MDISAALTMIREGRATQDVITTLIDAARAEKPTSDYDVHSRETRAAYLGNQIPRLRRLLQRRFPSTHQRIPAVTLNITTETAELDAQTYRETPSRFLLDANGAPVDEASAATYAEHVACARLDVVMPEFERVACAVETAFLRVRWANEPSLVGDKERHDVSVLWPHQVQVVPHETYPAELRLAHAIMVQVSGRGTDREQDGEAHEIWIRQGDQWTVETRARSGSPVGERVPYGGTLPIIVGHVRPTLGGIFATPDTDLLSLQDQVNVSLSDYWYGRAFQSHKLMMLMGGRLTPGTAMTMAPDALFQVDQPGATLQAIEPSQDQTTLDAIERSLTNHGRSRRQPVDAWFTKGGNPESGEARKIRNEYSDQKRHDHERLFVDVERRLAEVIVDTANRFAEGVTYPAGVVGHVAFAPPKVYESETAKVDRAIKMQSAGWWSDAMAAVHAGAWPSLDEAIAAGLSNEIKKKQPAPMFGAPLQPDAVDDEEGGDDGESDEPTQAGPTE